MRDGFSGTFGRFSNRREVQTLIFVPGWVHDPLGEADVVFPVHYLTHDPRPLALGGVVGTRLGLESPVTISLGQTSLVTTNSTTVSQAFLPPILRQQKQQNFRKREFVQIPTRIPET